MLDNWKTLGSRYANEGLEVHLIDQRNHGNSFWSGEFTYEAMAADLQAYVEHYSLDPAVVLGHSMGGKTAMQFACTYPEKAQKLIVADIAPKYYPPHHDHLLNALFTLPLAEFNSRSDAENALAQKIPEIATRHFLLKNLYWKEKGSLAFRCNLGVLREKSEEVGKALDASASYMGPALFIRSGNSGYVTREDETSIRGHFPSATLETIADAGHWLHAENPDLFFQVSLDFIKS
jgi:pimeloyl-ACP methyl ester carboxylesterase